MIFLDLQSKKVREHFSHNLHKMLDGIKLESVSPQVLEIVAKLNTLKKGLADPEYDFEIVLDSLGQINESKTAIK